MLVCVLVATLLLAPAAAQLALGASAATAPSVGTLIVCVDRATELADLDTGETSQPGAGGSDPFVAIFIGSDTDSFYSCARADARVTHAYA